MQTFSRLLSVVTLVLSFGFLAQALPVPTSGNALAARQYGAPEAYGNDNSYGDNSYGGHSNSGNEYGNGGEYGGQAGQTVDVLAMVTDLKTKIDPYVALLAAAQDVDAAKVQVAAIVVAVKGCAASLTGVTAQVADDVKGKIARVCLDIFIAIVTACAAVSVRIGVSVCLSLWAQIDVCLHLLLLTLNICVGGFLQVFVALFANIDITILTDLKLIHLDLCIKIFGLASKIASIAN